MPYVSIQTSRRLDEPGKEAFLKKTSAFFAELLGKPESSIMLYLEADADMLFARGGDPAAFVAVKSIGLPRGEAPRYVKEICSFLESEIAVDPARTYVELSAIDRELFGHNGNTFG
ncbi:MAG: hypothetical protein JRI97_08435 [Deltaproteobacteria bacterium]|nr:hypothetical protein [Deltaproteobacteria bacterium]